MLETVLRCKVNFWKASTEIDFLAKCKGYQHPLYMTSNTQDREKNSAEGILLGTFSCTQLHSTVQNSQSLSGHTAE